MPIELVKKPLGWKDGPFSTGKFLAATVVFLLAFFSFFVLCLCQEDIIWEEAFYKGLVAEEVR